MTFLARTCIGFRKDKKEVRDLYFQEGLPGSIPDCPAEPVGKFLYDQGCHLQFKQSLSFRKIPPKHRISGRTKLLQGLEYFVILIDIKIS